MSIITETVARALQPTRNDLDLMNFCELIITNGSRHAKCFVAASIYCPWSPSKPSERRPSHSTKFKNGWGAGYNTRTAYIDACIILRSKLGLWSSLADVEAWHRSLRVSSDFQIDTHMNSLLGNNNANTKYIDNDWVEVKDGKVKATSEGIRAYEEKHLDNHTVGIAITV